MSHPSCVSGTCSHMTHRADPRTRPSSEPAKAASDASILRFQDMHGHPGQPCKISAEYPYTCSVALLASAEYVVLDLSSLTGMPKQVWGPFATEQEADAFGLAHVGHWTIWPLDSPKQARPSSPL